jgi:hypothetical protein
VGGRPSLQAPRPGGARLQRSAAMAPAVSAPKLPAAAQLLDSVLQQYLDRRENPPAHRPTPIETVILLEEVSMAAAALATASGPVCAPRPPSSLPPPRAGV